MADELQDIHWKQSKIYDPNKDKQPEIHIYGCGSIGSHTTIALAKTGLKNITIYDMDKIEPDNIPSQFYLAEQEEQKTTALRGITADMTGQYIYTKEGKITETTDIKTTLNSIHILAFDNIEARRIVYNKLKDYPCILIDGRIGGTNYEIYTINTNNEEQAKKYEETLIGNFSEEECGNKSLWTTNSIIAAKITNQIIKIIKQKELQNKIISNSMTNITIEAKW